MGIAALNPSYDLDCFASLAMTLRKTRGFRRGFLRFHTLRFSSVRQNRQQQQCHDVGDLDYRVHRGIRRILVGIADGVIRLSSLTSRLSHV
jgi:hypothetical protein